MAEPEKGALSIALDTLASIARLALNVPWTRYISLTCRLVLLPLRIAFSPLRSIAAWLVGWLAVFFAPALFLLAYAQALYRGVVTFVVGLQPLYIFFSTAAIIGITAGIALAISSYIITTYLGMHDRSTYDDDLIKGKMVSQPSTISPITPESGSLSSIKSETYLMEHSPAQRRYASGLISQTILEEEDSDDV